MAKTNIIKKTLAAVLAGTLSVTLMACGGSADGQEDAAGINIEPYSKVEFNTELVKSGDIQSSLSLELQLEDFTSKKYKVTQSDYKVQEVKVKEGDRVAAGDVMVQFEAKDVQKLIDQYTDQKEKDQLSIDHYTRLAAIDSTQDYSDEIQAAKDDMELADTYIAEQNVRMKDYQIIAEQAGTVSFVSQDMQYGYATADSTLVTVDSGSSDYLAETEDNYEFEVGATYNASLDEAVFPMVLVSCDKYTSSATGLEMQKLVFEPAAEMAGVNESAKLDMVIEKPVVRNVVYVNKKAVFEGADGKKYVYTVDENGYRSAAEVTVGDTVDDYTVIKSGLEAGEQVVVN